MAIVGAPDPNLTRESSQGLQGPFLTSKHFLPNLLKSLNGKIVNTTSDFGAISTSKLAPMMKMLTQ